MFAILNAYKTWTMKHHQKEFGLSDGQSQRETQFCRKHHLNSRSLQECHLMVQELKNRLFKVGIHESNGPNRIQWNDTQKVIILKAVISGAFYPNIFTTDIQNDPMLEYEVFHAMNGRDPTKTVYFSGFGKENIREVYVQAIQNIFKGVVGEKNVGTIGISFDEDSEKVFVSFDSEKCNHDRRAHWESMRATIPGRISAEVYKAVKLRQSRVPIQLSLLPPAQEQQLAENTGIGVKVNGKFVRTKPKYENGQDFCKAPRFEDTDTGEITFVETCSKFWFQPSAQKEVAEHFDIELNAEKDEWLEPISNEDFKTMNKTVIVVGVNNGRFKRGRLTSWAFDELKCSYRCTIRFIDTGEIQGTSSDFLYVFNKRGKLTSDQAILPPQCYQCCLVEVKPSQLNISGGNQWEKDTIEYMQRFVEGKPIKIEVSMQMFSGTAGMGSIFNLPYLSIRLILLNYRYFPS